jgi:exonuclease SbcC
VTLLAKIEVHTDTLMRTREIEMMANLLSDEIAKFKLLEKGLGNDGLIALSIDDAGPEISSLCNDLLQSDFDNRFTVRLDTQRETLAGDTRETFAIKVFDSRGGEPTSLDDMSGGEQVWVNECLTRAIALHVSQSNGMQYHTLFTDEADGALDPERKRQFMQMKRAVLGKGGYGREYFISQTPELWEFADHVIDVGKL